MVFITKDEKLKRIEDIEKELAELKESIKEEDENNQLCWEPKLGERYYYITDYVEPYSEIWSESIMDSVDRDRLAIGNVFKTKEESNFAIERLKVIHELRQYAESRDAAWDGKKKHHYIAYNLDIEDINIYYNSLCNHNDIYFSSKEMAEKAVEAVGKDRIKKYYLEVE